MKVVRTIAEVETAPSTGLVPTMGALHAGHRALLAAARRENERVVMSLFVNPAQFDETSDLAAYPRDEARDLAIAEADGVDIVFAPDASELYPEGFTTWVEPEHTGAEGAARPGHNHDPRSRPPVARRAWFGADAATGRRWSFSSGEARGMSSRMPGVRTARVTAVKREA